jgi:tetratricopeptide (TPR) repeat protein
VGKTVLASLVVRRVLKEGTFPDGVVALDCQEMKDPVPLLQEILVYFDPERRPVDTVDEARLAQMARRLLKDKRALIILDDIHPELNIARVINPLRETGVKLLLISQGKLPSGVVPADARRKLELPTPDQALAIFTQWYGSPIATADASAAIHIVQALACNPLALRLAGAYAGELHRPLDVLATEFSDNPLNVPDGTGRPAVEVAFLESINHLDEDDQRLFTALAAFATESFGRRAAVALGASIHVPRPDGSIDMLLRRTLLDMDLPDKPEGQPGERGAPASRSGRAALPVGDWERLRLNRLLRSLARNRFAAWSAEEQKTALQGVASYYGDYVPRIVQWASASYGVLGLDEGNIIGALEWSHAEGQDNITLVLCLGMLTFWRARGRTAAMQRYLPWGIDVADARARESQALEDYNGAATLADQYGEALYFAGKLDNAAHVFTQNLVRYERSDDAPGRGTVLSWLGEIARAQGNLENAGRLIEEALTVHREALSRAPKSGPDRNKALELVSADLTSQGQLALDRGLLNEARKSFEEALGIDRTLDDRLAIGVDLGELGQIDMAQARYDEATRAFEEALEIIKKAENRREEGVALLHLGQVARARGDLDDAERYVNEALIIHREVENRQAEGVDICELGRIAHARGQLEEARDKFLKALDIQEEIQAVAQQRDNLRYLAQVAQEQGDLEKAESYLARRRALLN